MRILICEDGIIRRVHTLCEALSFSGGAAAFVGGGGKSSAIAQMARELSMQGMPVIVTTTTHMQLPARFYHPADTAGIAAALARGEIVTAGRQTGERRLSGGSAQELAALRALCGALLIEADGAHMRPFKAPEDWEPVLPLAPDLVVGVAGATALYAPIADCHRPHRVAAICEKERAQRLTPADMARVLQSPQGQRKGVDCRYEILVNQADDGDWLEAALCVAYRCGRAVLRGREKSDAL